MYEKCITCRKEFRGSSSGKCTQCRTIKCKQCETKFVQKSATHSELCKKCRVAQDYKRSRISGDMYGAI